MGWTAAAIIGSAVIGGIASSKAASAQKSASASAAGVSEKAAEYAKEQYLQTRADQTPSRQIGNRSLNELGALYFGSTGEDRGGGYTSPNGRTRRGNNEPWGPGSGGNLGWNGTPVIDEQGYSVRPQNAMAQYGRGGDTEMAHVTPGETVVPERIASQPGVRNALAQGFRQEGVDPSRFIVGGRNSLNPYTGAREFKYGADTNEGGATGFSTGNPRDTGQEQDRNRFNLTSNRTIGNRLSGPVATNPTQGFSPLTDPAPQYGSQSEAIGNFYGSPDYTINFDEGAKALEASAAARGGLFSGNTGTALVRYGQDYGNRLYNQYANRLASFAGLGQTATAQTGQFGAAAAGQGINAAGYQGNALMAGGNAAAQGWIGMGNSINAGIGNAMYYNQVR